MSDSKHDSEIELFDQAVIEVEKISATGYHVALCADPDQLRELTRLARVSEIGRFRAEIHVRPVRNGFQVTGQLHAQATQPCVVTLAPVVQRIEETLDRFFLPHPGKQAERATKGGSSSTEAYVELAQGDEPDYYSGNMLDLNDFLVEALGLSIDLYPRVPGAELPPSSLDADDASQSPFAVLKALADDQ